MPLAEEATTAPAPVLAEAPAAPEPFAREESTPYACRSFMIMIWLGRAYAWPTWLTMAVNSHGSRAAAGTMRGASSG